MSLDPSRLDPFSRAFAECWSVHYPDWAQQARVLEEGEPPFPLILCLDSPAGHPLSIDTANGEITIEFAAAWHGHITPGPGHGWKECMARAMELFEAIVHEHVFAALTFAEGRPSAGSLVSVESDWSRLEPRDGQGVRLASWRGTYDLILGVVPPAHGNNTAAE